MDGRAAYGFEARAYAAPDIEIVEAFCDRLDLDCIMTTPLLRKLAERSSSPVYFRYDHTLTVIGPSCPGRSPDRSNRRGAAESERELRIPEIKAVAGR